ncbi:MAG: transcription antitermination factor NusB [Deltaproteobacteria bacterium]|jgi:N utilization substance protein B|nr:transcription antitermination factor NusB [Deltaproteobacteria bacterium]
MRHQGRSYALQALYQAELLESKAMKHVDRFLEQLDTSPEVKLYARELVEGTLLHRKHIDRYLRRNLEHWKLTRLSATVRNILRLAAYELYHHPELSHSVIINEAVELCKDFVDDSAHALTNSVLQRVYDQITEERKTKALAKKDETSKDETSKDETLKAEPFKEKPVPESKYKRR